MNSLFLVLALMGGEPFEWAVDAPAFSWSVERSGDLDLPANESQARGTDAIPSFVHRIDVADRAGSCVCIAPHAFITAKHLFEGLSSFQVSIDGQPVKAAVLFSADHDVAIVRLNSPSESEPVAMGEAGYLADCTAYGVFSQSLHGGTVSNDDTLSLSSGEIALGDSGGGVFSDGKLVGVIRGRNPQNHRVCFFTPMAAVASLTAPFSPDAAPETAPGADTKPELTFWSPATWHCRYCVQMHGYDFSGEPYTLKDRNDDGLAEFLQKNGYEGEAAYPCVTWRDETGYLWVVKGLHTPAQLTSSWKQTQ